MNELKEMDQDGLKLKLQLQRAVRSEAPPPFLEARIRNTIRSTQAPRSWVLRLVPLGAALVICLAVGIAYQLGHLRLTTASQESYIASVSNRVASIMRVGLTDHIHCSVFRKFRKDPPSIEELTTKMGTQYKDLIPIVRDQVPADMRIVIAHQCGYHGRKFVHLSAKSDSKLMSLVIARKGDGESFATEDLLPALTQSGISFYRTGVQRFQIASFESRDYLVYLVSDYDPKKNVDMLIAMAPRLKAFLDKRES